MASPSGTCSGSSSIQNSSEDNLQDIMDQRKRKRMISNRESARRSRIRKQKQMDDLMAQVSQLRTENNNMLNNMNVVTQLYLNIEAENSVLRAQLGELSHRLQALNEIINCTEYTFAGFHENDNNYAYNEQMINEDDFLNPWSLLHVNQPIMASPDIFMY
ncbi:basic leucine-zipper 44 [Abeliophyllum distichum]|uniref:Basic leucine-zipper 44 n=1 Tax=Abeliophyllum distichum TaxID=126358 RepID=A0ABD1SAX2_9LAMI